MKITNEEQHLLSMLRKTSSDKLSLRGAAILFVATIAGSVYVFRIAGDFVSAVNMDEVDADTINLFKALGWGMIGMNIFVLGMLIFNLLLPSPSAALVLKLYERLQSAEQTSKDPHET